MVIHSESQTTNFEINDTIEFGDWNVNVGVLLSKDELFGQGLRKNSSNLSGFELAKGNRYLMKKIDWSDMIQPRVGANWDFSDTASVYVNYARYHPSASSLARAASWDRRSVWGSRSVNVSFDANGDFLEVTSARGGGGKLFQDGIEPRSIDELLLGMTKDVSGDLSIRAHVRYRKGDHFWEDTNNDARVNMDAPDNIPNELYIPNLGNMMADLGGGSDSSYVIAELDTGFTKYYEASIEADWNRDNLFLRGSYVWSHYYGNFDQDNSSTENDDNIFIGSSFIADDPGRQLWNFRKGDLRGDRRHQLKMYGFYNFEWNGSAGAFLVWQSGQPWEAWDVEVWRDILTAYGSTSTDDTSRYGEPAASRTTDSHYQLDLNYTHNFTISGESNIQLRVDMFNVTDNQTGYNIQGEVNGADFGDPRDYINPRRFQVAVAYQF